MSYGINLTEDNKKILLFIFVLIIVGFVYMKYIKKEQYENTDEENTDEENPNAATAAFQQFKYTFNL